MPSFLASSFSFARTKARQAYAWGLAHKVWAAVIIVAVFGGGYYTYAHYFTATGATQYVLAQATRGNLVVTVSGSGQVSANQELSLSPKASGEVTYVGVKAGDVVGAGTLIARVDDTDAEKSLRDALISLQSAQISYQQSVSNSDTSVSKALDTAITTSGSVMSDLPQIIKDLDSSLHDISIIPAHTSQQNRDAYASIVGGVQGKTLSDQTETSYQTALTAYKEALALSAKSSRSSSNTEIQNLIDATYTAITAASRAAGDTHTLITMVNDRLVFGDTYVPPAFTTSVSTITSDDAKANSDAGSALSAKSNLASALDSLSGSGVTLDMQSAQIALQKAQNAVADARTILSNYVVTAPFAGTIAKVNVQTHDQAGGSTAVATLITSEQYAQLSLNEVDAAKVKAGQKAQLTFDAVDGLTLAGTVAEVDSIGTVSSGVVTYSVKIAFDEQDARVRPGMTVNATIVTDSKQGALIVPSSAVQTTGGRSFVQVVTEGAPTPQTATTTGFNRARNASSTGMFASSTGRFFRMSSTTLPLAASTGRLSATETVDASSVTITRVPIEIGLTNDTQTEIVSGITEGTMVVSRTTSATATTAAASATTRTTGGGAAGGNRVFLRGG